MNPLEVVRQTTTIANHTFLTGRLDASAVVIDAGANVGAFAAELVHRYPVRVLSLEPHPDYFSRIPQHDHITKLQCALAAKEGTARLAFAVNQEASRLTGEVDAVGADVRTRTLEDLATDMNWRDIALIKLDIEGCEFEVLNGLSADFLNRVDQISVEFHDFAGYLTAAQVRECVDRLASHGFAAVKFSRTTYGDTLFLNQHRLRIGWSGLTTLRHWVRNIRGLRRIIGRRFGRQV